MIIINKEEACIIRKKFPNVHIVRTMKQKSKRHRYYCEENKRAMKLLNRLRETGIVSSKEGSDSHRNNKERKRD